MQVVFGLAMFGFSLVFFWMLNLTVRTRLLELGRRRLAIAREESADPDRAIAPEVVRLN